MDNRGLRVDSYEPKPLDSRSKQRWFRVLKTQAQARETIPIGEKDSKSIGGTLRKVSAGIWFKQGSVGRANGCDSSETEFWNKPEGATSTALDASFGLPTKKSELFLSSSTEPRSQEVPEGFKKNLSF